MSDDKAKQDLLAELALAKRDLAVLTEVIDSIPHRVFWKDRKSVWLGGNRNLASDCNVESPRDLVGCTDHDFFPKEHADFFQQCDREVMERGEPLLDIEEPQTRPDGSLYYLLTSKVPFRDPATNDVIGIIGIYVDITDRKRLEQKLSDALEGARSAAEAKRNFLAVVSHELRTPLALILGPLESLHQRVPEELRDDVALVLRNAVRLKDLVDDVLDFSRIEAGKLTASLRRCDVSQLVSDLATDVEQAAAARGLSLERKIAELAPLDTDPALLRKIVLNLVGNAIKFTPSGGTVKLGLEPNGSGDELTLTVSDTGPGIATEQQARLFDRFEQADNSRTRSAEGTGLGLALVKEFSEVLGGSVSVVSAPGEGATFHVVLPVQRELGSTELSAVEWGVTQKLSSTTVEEVVEQCGTGDIRVVVAEDNPDMRRHVRAVLENTCRLTLCSNGKLALDAVREEMPDVLVSDVMMPVMDGLELTRQIRADKALRALPVVLLTARAGDDATVEGLDAGADDYVAKPFSAAELIARVQAAARSHTLYRELAASQVQLSEANAALRKATEDLAEMEDLAVVGQLAVDAQREVAKEKDPSSDSRASLHDAMTILERVSSRLEGLNRGR